ncbi:MAG: hypothetical protein AABW53_02170 [Nanoarchaeota archaeon]
MLKQNVPKDKRDKAWPILEKEIQLGAKNKDSSFALAGKWKKFAGTKNRYKIFSVDNRWIKNNLCVYFGHGGHGLVHEFIPLDEIWVSSHHYNEGRNDVSDCSCKTNRKGQKVSKNYFDSTVIHEITECEEMKKGRNYWGSHQIALKKERTAGLLRDPFDDR